MPVAEYTKKAIKKYKKTSVRRCYIELYPTDADIKKKIAELNESGVGFQTYVKSLIRKDIKGGENEPNR